MSKTHELKLWPQYFQAVKDGLKTFEIRKNDREFTVGDEVVLQEWNQDLQQYTGRSLVREISYVTGFGQPDGQVVFGLVGKGDLSKLQLLASMR
jgi:hypothetical protein